MKEAVSNLSNWIKIITQVGIALIALGLVVEIVFGPGKLFGVSIVANLSAIVNDIGGDNGFVGLIAILIIFALVRWKVWGYRHFHTTNKQAY